MLKDEKEKGLIPETKIESEEVQEILNQTVGTALLPPSRYAKFSGASGDIDSSNRFKYISIDIPQELLRPDRSNGRGVYEKLCRQLIKSQGAVTFETNEDKVRAIFDDVDKDKSNLLDMEELGDLCDRLGINGLTAEDLSRELDADGNGEISYEEFKEWYTSLLPQKVEQIPVEPSSMPRRASTFRRMSQISHATYGDVRAAVIERLQKRSAKRDFELVQTQNAVALIPGFVFERTIEKIPVPVESLVLVDPKTGGIISDEERVGKVGEGLERAFKKKLKSMLRQFLHLHTEML